MPHVAHCCTALDLCRMAAQMCGLPPVDSELGVQAREEIGADMKVGR